MGVKGQWGRPAFQGCRTFFAKGWMVNILGFMASTVSSVPLAASQVISRLRRSRFDPSGDPG